jgi:hypothetical protein
LIGLNVLIIKDFFPLAPEKRPVAYLLLFMRAKVFSHRDGSRGQKEGGDEKRLESFLALNQIYQPICGGKP